MPRTAKRPDRFRDRTELLDFLLEVTTVITSTIDLDQQLAALSQMLNRVVPSELMAILLYSERLKGLRIRYAIGHREETVRNLVIPLNEGITGVAASARMPIVAGDVRNDPRYLPAVEAVRSEMAVPMVARGRLVGVIDLQSTRENAYTQDDSALVQLVASRVAASIVNARLFRRVERQNRTLGTLAALAKELSSVLDLDALLKLIATRVRDLISYDGFTIFLLDEERRLLRSRFSLRYDERVTVDNVPLDRGITGAAGLSREIIVVEDTSSDPRYIEFNSTTRSEVAVPLLAEDRLVGVMDLESERIGYFTSAHVQTLTLIAPLIANALVNASLYEEIAKSNERMEADLAAARQLQSMLLPRKPPEIPGLEVAIAARPAHEITGDVYDFVVRGEDYAAVLLGDVSGKSAAAALYGAMVSGLLRTIAPRRRSPAHLMTTLNQTLLERQVGGRYLTLIVLLWEPKSKMLTMSGAGATPPLICRGGQMIQPKLEGVPLGLLPGTAYDEIRFAARPGDLIVLYSDGIQDQQNPADELYGEVRLAPLVQRMCLKPARSVVKAILGDIDKFRGDRDVADDQTLIAMKVKEA
jgi:sigma-B regulation protein RsbU (phosphoserine phosphatase)